MWFSQNSNRALCVMSPNGSVSNVTLRQSATSGGTVTYEGRFEILSLSGSFMVTEIGGQRTRTGGLSVSLSGPDGRVLGGNVSGLLTAASPVQRRVGEVVMPSLPEKDDDKDNGPEFCIDSDSNTTTITEVDSCTNKVLDVVRKEAENCDCLQGSEMDDEVNVGDECEGNGSDGSLQMILHNEGEPVSATPATPKSPKKAAA